MKRRPKVLIKIIREKQANLPPPTLNDQVLALRADLRNANSNVIDNPTEEGYESACL